MISELGKGYEMSKTSFSPLFCKKKLFPTILLSLDPLDESKNNNGILRYKGCVELIDNIVIMIRS